MEERKKFLRKERIFEYLENIKRQLSDLEKLKVPSPDFFEAPTNFERSKAIKYSLACAIQDVCRIALHIAATLELVKVKESESEAILALAEAGIIPKEFAEKIKPMPAFRNRLIHDYLPNRFDAERLYNALERLGDFREFSQYIIRWLERL